MNIKLSIEAQKRAGKYERNQAIKILAKGGLSYALIGRMYGLSRERIRQIVNREDKIRLSLWQRLLGRKDG